MTTVKKNILSLIVFRLIIVTTLLVAAVVIQLSTAVFLPLGPFYVVILFAYAACLVFLLIYAKSRRFQAQAYAQVLFDILLITVLVYITGGLRGHLYVLYAFPILAAGMVLPGRASYLMASLSAILLGFLADGMFFGLIPYYLADQARETSAGLVLYTIFLAWALFAAMAFLSGHYGRSIRKAKDALGRVERELAIRERLAEAGKMSALIAHEIRNPLAAISGAVQVLKMELKPTGEPAQLMDIILRESKRVSQTIEQYLNLASPGPRDFQRFSMAAVVRETLTLLRAGGELGEGIRVEGNFDASSLDLYGSQSQFKQVVWNLIRNAIQAMPDGGWLRIDLNGAPGGGRRLRLADSGRGMNAAERARIFEPFFTTFDGGRGLGLTVVRRIVDDFEGTIEVLSEAGLGTEFILNFPERAAPSRPKEA
ncbi:MAG: ATP-binding protein [Candidatus Aminicenantes bacterium]|nr:ATP-binding protein [Candidatus Aminicenantes bacterium]